jgi:hypothetical protein
VFFEDQGTDERPVGQGLDDVSVPSSWVILGLNVAWYQSVQCCWRCGLEHRNSSMLVSGPDPGKCAAFDLSMRVIVAKVWRRCGKVNASAGQSVRRTLSTRDRHTSSSFNVLKPAAHTAALIPTALVTLQAYTPSRCPLVSQGPFAGPTSPPLSGALLTLVTMEVLHSRLDFASVCFYASGDKGSVTRHAQLVTLQSRYFEVSVLLGSHSSNSSACTTSN